MMDEILNEQENEKPAEPVNEEKTSQESARLNSGTEQIIEKSTESTQNTSENTKENPMQQSVPVNQPQQNIPPAQQFVNQPYQQQIPQMPQNPQQYYNQVPNNYNQYQNPVPPMYQNRMNYNQPGQNRMPMQGQNQMPMPGPNQNPYINNQAQNPQYNAYGQPVNNPYMNTQAPKMVYNPVSGTYEPQKKQKTNTATIVLIVVICMLIVSFTVGIIVFLSTQNRTKSSNDFNNNDNSIQSPTFGDDENPFSDYFFNNNQQPQEYETTEVEIELVEDKGESQKGENDKEGAKPDESFKDLKAEKTPEDAKTGDYTSESAYEKVSPAVVAVQCFKDKISDDRKDLLSEGTGTVVSKDGYIVTNSHVIGNSKEYAIRIQFNDKTTKEAKVVGFDGRTDLAVLKIDADDLEYVTFGDTSTLSVGEDIIAIGNPGGTSFQNSLTKGIISFVGREITLNDLVDYIQIDASINPGNSGGPLCNLYGQVIGINTAKIASTEYEGMGFAIPADTVMDIANDLIHYGYVKGRVRLGISGVEVSAEETYYYGTPSGIYVETISDDSPLKDKIKEGDIITSVDGTDVTTFQNVYAVLNEHKAGDKIKITYAREKTTK